MLPYDGTIRLDGADLRRMRREEVARRVSYLPQDVSIQPVLTAFEVALLARRRGMFHWRTANEDLDRIERALSELEIDHLASRYLNELSGGQRQLVSIAQALVREPEVLLLDEPTSNLDLQRQLEVLEHVRRISRDRGIVTVVTLHDLNLACRFADHRIVLTDGRIYATGTPAEAFTEEMLADVYGVRGQIVNGEDGVPYVHATGSLRDERQLLHVSR